MKGVDDVLLTMDRGEEKEITVPALDAYGEPNPDLIMKVPLYEFPDDLPLDIGQVFTLPLPSGDEFQAAVIDIADGMVTVDLNHPLAGRTLVVTIKVILIAD
jgi:peptidylprolyl isomerase